MNLQSIINKLKTYHYTAFEILYYWEHSPEDFLDNTQLSKSEVDFLRNTNPDSKIVIDTLYPNGVKLVNKEVNSYKQS